MDGRLTGRLISQACLLAGLATLATLVPGLAWAQQAAASAASAVSGDVGQAASDSKTLMLVGTALLKYAVLAVVVESALTPVFNWRLFIRRFDGKGFKVPVAVIVSFALISSTNLDLIADVLEAFHGAAVIDEPLEHFMAWSLGALLVAGGSDGILRLYGTLGLRAPIQKRQDQTTRATMTTVHVVVERGSDVTGPIQLSLNGGAPATVNATDWVFRDVPPGPTLIEGNGTNAKGDKVAVSEVIEVTAATPATASLSFATS